MMLAFPSGASIWGFCQWCQPNHTPNMTANKPLANKKFRQITYACKPRHTQTDHGLTDDRTSRKQSLLTLIRRAMLPLDRSRSSIIFLHRLSPEPLYLFSELPTHVRGAICTFVFSCFACLICFIFHFLTHSSKVPSDYLPPLPNT